MLTPLCFYHHKDCSILSYTRIDPEKKTFFFFFLKMGMDEFFAMSKMRKADLVKRVVIIAVMAIADAADTNDVYSPCLDAKVQRGDGFTFGIAFSDKEFFSQGNGPQLSPCDKRLDLANKGAQLSVFRPTVDEISLLTINRSIVNAVYVILCLS